MIQQLFLGIVTEFQLLRHSMYGENRFFTINIWELFDFFGIVMPIMFHRIYWTDWTVFGQQSIEICNQYDS